MAQRIIIPKGTVNPGETSVIEIPHSYEASNLVVATPKPASRHSTRGEQNVSEESKYGTPSNIPWTPEGTQRAWSDPMQLRWQTPQGKKGFTPPSVKSFTFGLDESIYDDSPIRERRRRQQVASPPDKFFLFRYGARSAKEKEGYTTPEGQGPSQWRPSPPRTMSPTEHNWRAEKMRLLNEVTDWGEMNDYIQKLEGNMFEHDVKFYQKSRKNLLYNVSKVACDAFKTMTSLKKRRKKKLLKKEAIRKAGKGYDPANRRLF